MNKQPTAGRRDADGVERPETEALEVGVAVVVGVAPMESVALWVAVGLWEGLWVTVELCEGLCVGVGDRDTDGVGDWLGVVYGVQTTPIRHK